MMLGDKLYRQVAAYLDDAACRAARAGGAPGRGAGPRSDKTKRAAAS